MREKKKHKQRSQVLKDLQRERKKARSLGYGTIEEYERGLSTVKRLLADKHKGSSAESDK